MTEKKNEGTMELVPVQDDLDIFKKFDEMDDQIVLAEIEKRVVDVWVYHFKQSGHDIWGLAKEGVDQCSILMGQQGIALREEELKFEIDPTSKEHVIFTAKVSKHLIDKTGKEAAVDTVIGTKRQSLMRKMKTADGYRMESNPFWAEQGGMKALRNAKMRLIPADIKAKVIANAKELKGKVKSFKAEPIKEKKEKEKPTPDEKKTPPKDEPKQEAPKFPDDEEQQPEELKLREASASQKKKVTAMMQTMVDKYRFAPEDVLEKMGQKAGGHDISTYSDIQAEKVIKYFQWVFDYKENEKG